MLSSTLTSPSPLVSVRSARKCAEASTMRRTDSTGSRPRLFASLSEDETPLRPLSNAHSLLRRKRVLSPVHYSGGSDRSSQKRSQSSGVSFALIPGDDFQDSAEDLGEDRKHHSSGFKIRSTLSRYGSKQSSDNEEDDDGYKGFSPFGHMKSASAPAPRSPKAAFRKLASIPQSPMSRTKLAFFSQTQTQTQTTVQCTPDSESTSTRVRDTGAVETVHGNDENCDANAVDAFDDDAFFDELSDSELIAAFETGEMSTICSSQIQGVCQSKKLLGAGETEKQGASQTMCERLPLVTDVTEAIEDDDDVGIERAAVRRQSSDMSLESASGSLRLSASIGAIPQRKTRKPYVRLKVTDIFRVPQPRVGGFGQTRNQLTILEGNGYVVRADAAESMAVGKRRKAQRKVYTVELRGEWADSLLEVGDYVHVIADGSVAEQRVLYNSEHSHSQSDWTPQFPNWLTAMEDSPIIVDCSSHFIVDDERGLVVLNPDTLVIPTKIASSFPCPRLTVVSGLISNYEESRALLFGTMAHELFEDCLPLSEPLLADGSSAETDAVSDSDSVASRLKRSIEHIIGKYLVQLCAINETEASARSALRAFIPNILAFLNNYCADARNKRQLSSSSSALTTVSSTGGKVHWGFEKRSMAVTEVCDIEECMWCPQFGIQGNVDSIMAVKMKPFKVQRTFGRSQKKKKKAEVEVVKHALVPFELKTGKDNTYAQLKARAQLAMYSLMVSERYNVDLEHIEGGLLYFLKTDKLLGVPLPHGEIRALLMRRNFLSTFLKAFKRKKDTMAKTSVGKLMDDALIGTVAGDNAATVRFVGSAFRRLPPLLSVSDKRVCEMCFTKSDCFIFNEISKEDAAETTDTSDLPTADGRGLDFDGGCAEKVSLTKSAPSIEDTAFYKEEIKHLLACDKSFIRKWLSLLELEAEHDIGSRHQIWTMPAWNREAATGRCLSNMTVRSHEFTGYIHLYTFQRHASYFTDDSPTAVDASDDSFIGHNSRSVAEKSKVPIARWKLRLKTGDSIVISTQTGHYGLAKGRLVELTTHSAKVATYQKVRHLTPNAATRIGVSVFRLDLDDIGFGFGTLRANVLRLFERSAADDGCEKITDRMADVSVRMQKEATTVHRSKLQRLLIDCDAPEFDSFVCWLKKAKARESVTEMCRYLRSQFKLSDALVREFKERLNDDQKSAVCHALGTRDYTCVLGMPGTGKSTVLVFLIRALLCANKESRILLCAFTNTAVDHLCLKLVQYKAAQRQLLRVGHSASIDPKLKAYMLLPPDTSTSTRKKTASKQLSRALATDKTVDNSFESVSQLRKLLDSKRVFACTSLSAVRQSILKDISFDVCFVDESGQITEPQVLGPLQKASRFVLFGDFNQLPPMVGNPLAASQGLGRSLFERLSKLHSQSTVTLSTQYRMCTEVMSVSNELVYGGQMKCANDGVANQRLELPRIALLRSVLSGFDDYMAAVCDAKRKVLFLNTDRLLAADSHRDYDCSEVKSSLAASCKGKHKMRTSNECEAVIVAQCVACLSQLGVRFGDIGVMAPYRAQLTMIQSQFGASKTQTSPTRKSKRLLQREAVDADTGDSDTVLLDTVDRFQGRDCDVIIISLTHSPGDEVMGILRDWRRVNVALTRAKKKLLLIGSLTVFHEMKPRMENDRGLILKKLVAFLKAKRNWIVDL